MCLSCCVLSSISAFAAQPNRAGRPVAQPPDSNKEKPPQPTSCLHEEAPAKAGVVGHDVVDNTATPLWVAKPLSPSQPHQSRRRSYTLMVFPIDS